MDAKEKDDMSTQEHEYLDGGSPFEPYSVVYATDNDLDNGEHTTLSREKVFSDPWFDGNPALYGVCNAAPRGAVPSRLVDWNRLSRNEVKGYEDAKLFSPDSSRTVLSQGQARDRWLLNALALIASSSSQRPRRFLQAIFKSTKRMQKGIITLRFFKEGSRRVVHIDDRIPCDQVRFELKGEIGGERDEA